MQSDSQEEKLEKSLLHEEIKTESNHNGRYTSTSPNYDAANNAVSTDSSTDTYEAAIENYKSTILRVSNSSRHVLQHLCSTESKSSTSTSEVTEVHKRASSSKIENILVSLETKDNYSEIAEKEAKQDVPKIDIAKRRELFEKAENNNVSKPMKNIKSEVNQVKSIKERLSGFEREASLDCDIRKEPTNLSSGDFEIPSVKGRYLILEKNVQQPNNEKQNKIDVPLSVSLKDRLSSLQSCVNSSSAKTTTTNNINDERLVILVNDKPAIDRQEDNETVDTDREDSGIHTTDVSCCVSQADEQNEERFDDLNSVNNDVNNRIEETVEQNVIEIQVSGTSNEDHREMNYSIPDLIQHEEVAAIAEDSESSMQQDTSVSHSLSEIQESVIFDGTLLLDVKQLIDNLASDKVEGSSINSNDFDETTTLNTSSMFDDTTANDEDSSIISLASPYRKQYTELTEEDNSNLTTLPTPILNLNLTCIKNADDTDESSSKSNNKSVNNEIVLDYFNKTIVKEHKSIESSSSSSPRSPSRSIINFIKSNLLGSNSEQETSKFYIPLFGKSNKNDQNQIRKQSENIVKAKELTKTESIESDQTMSSEINLLLDDEISKL